MENPRTTAARDHDDHVLIDSAEDAPSASGTSGGNMQRELASQAELDSVAEPEGHNRVTKSTTLEHGTEQRTNRARAPDAGA